MIRLLLKVKFRSLFSNMLNKGINRNGKKGSGKGAKLMTVILFLYLAVFFVAMFCMLFNSLCVPFVEAGLDWFYYTATGITAFALCIIGSVFTTQSQLYEAKDNELLLSMPIKPSCILGSRMVFLYTLNLIYASVVMIPAEAVHAYYYGIDGVSLVFFILILLLLPGLGLTFACLIGWLISLATSRMRSKTLFSMVLSIGFLAAYMYFYSSIGTYITRLIEYGDAIADAVRKTVPPAYYIGIAVTKKGVPELLLFAACCIIPFILVYIILSKSFIKIATAKRGVAKIKYREKAMGVRSIRGALLWKELKRFFTCATYMMNSGIGLVMSLITAVAMIIKKDELIVLISSMYGTETVDTQTVSLLVIAVLCFISTMNSISSSTISLEGKSLWILVSSPVRGRDILMAKAGVHIILCLPVTVMLSVISAILFKTEISDMIMMIISPLVFLVFCAFLGIIINLRFPKLQWMNETAAIKQGVSVLLTMAVTMCSIFALFILYIAVFSELVSIMVYILLATLFIGLVDVLLFIYINGRGGRVFEEKFCD